MSEWISVDDRLPYIDKPVLVVDVDSIYENKVGIGYYDIYSREQNKYYWRDQEYINIRVTHWMNLPNPPKHKERNE